jgi:hypothetical protein
MRRQYRKAAAAGICALLAALVLAGCQENSQVEGKKNRLYAAENIALEKKLSGTQTQLAENESLLAECRAENERLQTQIRENTSKLVMELLQGMGEKQKKLAEENEQLKAELETLKQ